MFSEISQWPQVIHINIFLDYNLLFSYEFYLRVSFIQLLDLHLPMQSVHITSSVVSSHPAQARCTRYNIVIKLVIGLRQVCGFLCALWFPSPIQTDRHDKTKILLDVALDIINMTSNCCFFTYVTFKVSSCVVEWFRSVTYVHRLHIISVLRVKASIHLSE
jgi:hypothetical protein